MKTFKEIREFNKKIGVDIVGVYIDVNSANRFYANIICRDKDSVYFQRFTNYYMKLKSLKNYLNKLEVHESDIYDKCAALSME